MSRRRRKKLRRQREMEALQVELLAEHGQQREADEAEESTVADAAAVPPAEPDAAAPPRAEAAMPPRAEPAELAEAPEVEASVPPPAPEPTPPADGIDDPPPERWARAVGRRLPHRPAASEAARPNGESLRPPNGQELHESARDHAAAGVRPAGEPLARAKELVQQGRADEAIELYMGILTVNPGNLKAHNNLGVLLDELRQYESALEHFAAAEQIAPENVEVLTNYAATLTSIARYDQADALLRRAQRLDAESVSVRAAIGILYFRRGLYAQSETELRWVCARDRDHGQAFYYRGEALNRLGRFDEARQAMERAKALLPNDPRPFYTLGHLYDRQHQAAEAAEMYRQARRLQKR